MLLGLLLVPVTLGVADPSVTGAANDVQQRYERWERRLRARVADLHVFPASAKPGPACDVVISFAVGRDERPSDPAIRTSSCSPFYDRAAYRLVRSLGRVGRVPSMSGNEHRVVLKLTYGSAPSAIADRDLTAALKAEGQAHSRRNIEIVTTAAHQASVANWQSPEQ
jgi:hypothetical protein